MAKFEKLVSKLLSNPKDFTWNELTTVLSHVGYRELKGGGSRRKFVDDNKNVISLHKPHPGNVLKHYQIKDIIIHLQEKGKITNE